MFLLALALGCSADPTHRRPGAPASPDSSIPPVVTDTQPAAPETSLPVDSAVTDTGPHMQVLGVVVRDRPNLVLAKRFEVETNFECTMAVTCSSPDVPSEDHRLSSDELATLHVVDVSGLLADTSYACTATATGAQGTGSLDFTAQVGPMPFAMPALDVRVAPGAEISDAYTGFNYFRTDVTQQRNVIVDPEGRARWYWAVPDEYRVGIEFDLAPGYPRVFVTGGGQGLRPHLLRDDSDLVWTGPLPLNGGRHHHDVQVIPSGDVLTLSDSTNHGNGLTWEGFRLEVVSPVTNEVSWRWDSQRAVDNGELPPRQPGENNDIYHANAASWVEDADGTGVVVSLAERNRVIRIDVPTRSVVWSLGRSGDFQLLDADGAPIVSPAEWFYYQHDPELNGNRMFIHDNGRERPTVERYSRAIELQLDTAAMTATLVWEYRQEGWYENVWGDVDLLRNGNVLVAQGNGGGTPSFRSAVLEIDPTTNTLVHRFEFPERKDAIYRAERIGGCELFDNRAYCPAP